MKKLTAFYFSGTGNTRYVTEELCRRLSPGYQTQVLDISEPADQEAALSSAESVLLAFPIYGSSPPVPMRRFVYKHIRQLKDKELIVVATQYLFSGDGAASLGRTIERLGGRVSYAEHFDMPNNLSDCTALKIRNREEIERMLRKAERRMDGFARRILAGKSFRRGFHPIAHAVGYFCQRKWWRKTEDEKRGALKVDPQRCIGCGLCCRSCPVHNIVVEQGKARPQGDCALCYRCVNLCPKQAIVLFGKQPPVHQYRGPRREN